MEQKNKETTYWLLVGIYGGLLCVALLYLRFPVEKFKAYCENLVEKNLPGVNCTIARVSYDFPLGLNFEKMRISEGSGHVFFEDNLFSLAPTWRSLTSAYAVESRAFGGYHSALISIDDNEENIVFKELQIDELALKEIPAISAMERPITGTLSGSGTLRLNRLERAVTGVEGDFSLSESRYELGRPLFLITNIVLPQTTFRLAYDEGVARLTQGVVKTPQIEGGFQGDIILADTLESSRLKVSGRLMPKTQLFPESRQLQAVVAGVQRRYRSEELPFKLGGTVGRPSFIFSR